MVCEIDAVTSFCSLTIPAMVAAWALATLLLSLMIRTVLTAAAVP
jgi:hypothetical protein